MVHTHTHTDTHTHTCSDTLSFHFSENIFESKYRLKMEIALLAVRNGNCLMYFSFSIYVTNLRPQSFEKTNVTFEIF